MLFLPGTCDRCWAVQLVTSADCLQDRAHCSTCGGHVVLVGGRAYGQRDVFLFNELCSATERASLSPVAAARLALALAGAGATYGETEALEAAVSWFPDLATLRSILGANLPRVRQALSMLNVILCEQSKRAESQVS